LDNNCHFTDTCPENKDGKCTKEGLCWLKKDKQRIEDIGNGEVHWIEL
jgi:hypothetical protein